jgi:hypothetical protein
MSVMVKFHIRTWKLVTGFPGREKRTVTATSAKGSATNERLKVNAIPRFANAFTINRKDHEKMNAIQAPSGKSAFESIVITVKGVGVHVDLRFVIYDL